jgi:site-specific recombinase XerD
MSNYDKNTKVYVYPKDAQKVGKRGFYIRIYYGQKPLLNKVTGETEWDEEKGQVKTTSYKEERYFSDLTIHPTPRNDSQRLQNKNVRKIVEEEAEAIRVDIRTGKFKRNFSKDSKYLMHYMTHWSTNMKNYSKSGLDSYISVRRHFLAFNKTDIPMEALDKRTCNGFWTYLQNVNTVSGRLSEATYKNYFSAFKFYLYHLENEELIDKNPAKHIVVGTAKSKVKEFLEKEELKLLEKSECTWEVIKRYYLFGSYSAITLAECQIMKWADFSKDKEANKWFVRVTRQKTKKEARLKVSDIAMSFILPERNNDELVFPHLKPGYSNTQLKQWIASVGIQKNLTLHSAKNNFAVMYYRFNEGKYIGDLMKALQHKDISTTQRYLAGLLGSEMGTGGSIDFE